MTVTAADIRLRLSQFGSAPGYCIAFSGGPDSHVLLHALAALRPSLAVPVRALHVNHRLHPDAATWARHCEAVCGSLGVPLETVSTPAPPPGAGETWAREQRYAIFAARLQPGELLLTAHHLDDQAETVLLRLLRGSGVDGLGGIPPSRVLGSGRVARPLLDLPRNALRAYARDHELESIADPGNHDPAADRNFLRHEVLPLLRQRWPRAEATIARAGALLREEQEFVAAQVAPLVPELPGAPLPVEPLQPLAAPHQRLVLRRWLSTAGLPMPAARQLEAGRRMVLLAGADRQPAFRWPGGCVRRYRDHLFLQAVSADSPPVTSGAGRDWGLDEDLRLEGGWLRRVPATDGLDPARLPARGVTIAFRRGGESCRPAGRPTRPVKKLFQEAGVPPWQRAGWPLLMAGERIVAIPGVCVCEGFQAVAGATGLRVAWEPDEGPTPVRDGG